jgi:calcineurin-like phosphoesterase family protein
VLTGLQNALFVFVLNFFESINRKIQSKLPFWRMKEETSEHVRMLIEVFEFVVLPASVLYLLGNLFLLQENAFDSTLWAY